MAARKAGVLYHAIVYGGSGYADLNLGVLLGLLRHQVPVQLAPIGLQADARGLLDAELRETLEMLRANALELARSVLYQGAPVHDCHPHARGRSQVVATAFETDRIPDGWRERLQEADEVWVPSQFNRQTFAAAGVEEHKLRVLPEGVDTTQYRPGVEPLNIPHARGFNFLSVFDWQQRKGFDVLLRAYLREFRPDEDVALLLKISTINRPGADPATQLLHFVEREMGLPLEKTPPIIVLNGFLPTADMVRLYASASAFVLPSRGEGWGRPYLEALACQRPVLATRWSGQLDFLHDGNSYLIEPEAIVPVREPDLEIFAGHRWADPSVDHLRQLMRRVFSHPEEARRKAALGRAETLRRWDWMVVSDLWVKEFERLLT